VRAAEKKVSRKIFGVKRGSKGKDKKIANT
jgi:hypothetical protein